MPPGSIFHTFGIALGARAVILDVLGTSFLEVDFSRVPWDTTKDPRIPRSKVLGGNLPQPGGTTTTTEDPRIPRSKVLGVICPSLGHYNLKDPGYLFQLSA